MTSRMLGLAALAALVSLLPGPVSATLLAMDEPIARLQSEALPRPDTVPPGDAPARSGCPRAHCDARNSDFANLLAPQPANGPIDVVWGPCTSLQGEQQGSHLGLGCSGNGEFAVCTYQGPRNPASGCSDTVVAYDYDGAVIWSSADRIDRFAFASAPLIMANGDTIVADAHRVVRFAADGGVRWDCPLPYGGIPISPVLTPEGVLVVSTRSTRPGSTFPRGPIYALDAQPGAATRLLEVRYVSGTSQYDGSLQHFESQNTAAMLGNRVFLSMHLAHPDGTLDGSARLVAIDVDRSARAPDRVLEIAWQFEFATDPVNQLGSRSSPLVLIDADAAAVVLFDGYRLIDGQYVPGIFAVDPLDGAEVAVTELPAPTVASFAADPRGGFWHFMKDTPIVTHRSAADLSILEYLNLNTMLDHPGASYVSSSALTVAGTATEPVLIFGVRDLHETAPSYVWAIPLVEQPLQPAWKVVIDPWGFDPAPGQFAILDHEVTGPRVVFTTMTRGAQAIGVMH